MQKNDGPAGVVPTRSSSLKEVQWVASTGALPGSESPADKDASGLPASAGAPKVLSELERELLVIEEEALQLDSEVHYTEDELTANRDKALELRARQMAEKVIIEPTLLIWRPEQDVKDLVGLPEEEIQKLLGNAELDQRPNEDVDFFNVNQAATTTLVKKRGKTRLEKMQEVIHRSYSNNPSTLALKAPPKRPPPKYGKWYVDPSKWGNDKAKDKTIQFEMQPHELAKESLKAPMIDEVLPLTQEELSLPATRLYKDWLMEQPNGYVFRYLNPVKTSQERAQELKQKMQPKAARHHNKDSSPSVED